MNLRKFIGRIWVDLAALVVIGIIFVVPFVFIFLIRHIFSCQKLDEIYEIAKIPPKIKRVPAEILRIEIVFSAQLFNNKTD